MYRHGRDCLVVGFKVASSNPVHGELYWIQQYVIKFVSDLRQVGGFLLVPPISSNKTDHHDITEILLKGALNTINLNFDFGIDRSILTFNIYNR